MIADREQYFANRLALVWASQVVEGLLQPACVCPKLPNMKKVIGPITYLWNNIRSRWYLMTGHKSFFHTRVKGACYLQNKHLYTPH